MKANSKRGKSPARGQNSHRSAAENLREEIARLKELRRLDQVKLRVVREISRLSHSKVRFDAVLERTVNLALQALNTDAGTLFVLDEIRQELVFQVVRGPAKTVKQLRGQRLKVGEGIVGHVVKTGKPYVSLDVAHDRKWQKSFSVKAGYHTKDMLCAPLRSSHGKVLGAIQVLNQKNRQKYTHDDLEVLCSIADQIGIVLENVNLVLSQQKRMRELAQLHGISSILTSSLDRVEVRKTALEAVVSVMDCETGSLYQVDKENNELYFDVMLSGKDEIVKTTRLKIGEGIAGWVAKERQAVVVADCANDPRFAKKVDKASQFVTRNMLCAPLVVNGELIGVLQALNRRTNTFTRSDLLVFTDLANQVAIALKNALLFEELHKTFHEAVTALSDAIELRDPYTGGHTQRVRKYSLAIGKYMGLEPEELEVLSLSAILHDIGKIGVSDVILRKQGKLDNDEFAEMKKHPEYGFNVLKHFPSLSMTYDGVLYHHERFDGRGYPKGLKGEAIPLMARIIAVADTFDAMTTNRPYRDGLDLDFVVKELKTCAGSQFDKKAVAAFMKAFERNEILKRT